MGMINNSSSSVPSVATLDTLAQRVAETAASQGKTAQKETARTVTDRVDLSQTAKLAADYKASAGTDGKKPADQLAESLKQAKSVTDSFAAQLSGNSTASTKSDFNAVVRDEVASIMKEGKPSDLISRIVKRLFG